MDDLTPTSDRKTDWSTTGHLKTSGVEVKSGGFPRIVIIRGLPGSGKSTMASVLNFLGYQHFEADMFFTDEFGVYRHDPSRINEAHEWCKSSVRAALERGQRVVVCNTFTRIKEIEPYLTMTSDVQVLEACGKWRNQHGVPLTKISAMRARWEPLPSNFASGRWSAQ